MEFNNYFQLFSNKSTQFENQKNQLKQIITSNEFKIENEEQINKTLDLTQKLIELYVNNGNIKSTVEETSKYISTKSDDNSNISYNIGNILISTGSILFQDTNKSIALNEGSLILMNTFNKNSKNNQVMDTLISTFDTLSKITQDENKRMYYVSRNNELIRYKTALENGEDAKLSPSSVEKLQKAFAYKESGTEAFKNSDWKKAIFQYHCANNYVTGLLGLPDGEESIAKSLNITLLNNIAVCNMKLLKWGRAIEILDKVIANEPDNVKALFRRGKCLIQDKQFIYAEEDLQKALSLSPGDKEILNEIKILNAKSKEYNKVQAKVYSKMFEDEN